MNSSTRITVKRLAVGKLLVLCLLFLMGQAGPGGAGGGGCACGKGDQSSTEEDGTILPGGGTRGSQSPGGSAGSGGTAPEEAVSPSVCGNGDIESGEACDDANTVDGDGCTDCQVDERYTCASGAPSHCTLTPPHEGTGGTGSVCGNGIVEPGEFCDDTNTRADDGCASCVIAAGYTCSGAPSICRRTPGGGGGGTPSVCGNGIIETGEMCDDANATVSDGCTSCRVDAGYVCSSGAPSVCNRTRGGGGTGGTTACYEDYDCPRASPYCVSGVCSTRAPACPNDAYCAAQAHGPGDGRICITGTGVCGCNADPDCNGRPYVCRSHRCVEETAGGAGGPPCTTDAECSAGTFCTWINGVQRCSVGVRAICTSNAACSGGQVCNRTTGNCENCTTNAQCDRGSSCARDGLCSFDLIPALTGTINLITRDGSPGRLHLCQGTSAPLRWTDRIPANSSDIHYRCIDLPTEGGAVQGQAAAVFEPGADGGKIHIFAHNQNDFISYTSCPARNPTTATCRSRVVYALIAKNPSVVLLSNGSLYVFYQNKTTGKIAYADVLRNPGPTEFDNVSLIDESLANPGRDGRMCGPIWESPMATVKTGADGRESLYVFARDNHSFNGHIRVASLPNPLEPNRADRRWDCLTFDSGFGQDDTGPLTLGSSPVAFFNKWTNQFNISGMEFLPSGGSHKSVFWKTRTRPDGTMGLEPSREIGHDVFGMDFPSSHIPSLVVRNNGEMNGAVHLFYRSPSDHRVPPRGGPAVIDAHSENVRSGETLLPDFILLDGAAMGAPGGAIDGAGNLHVFAGRQITGRGWIPPVYHFFKPASGGEWVTDFVDIPISDSDASPTVLFTPNPYSE